MSTAVEKRMLSPEEIEAQTALVLPERELMWHHKHHHHHHHHVQQTIIIICVNNEFHKHFPHPMGGPPWGNQPWDGQSWDGQGQWGGNFFPDNFNNGCGLQLQPFEGPFGHPFP